MNKCSARTWLQEARLNAGYTQQRLAVKLEVSLTAVQKWEGGHTAPMAAHARELDRLLVDGSGELKSRFDAEREAARQADRKVSA